MRSNQLFRIDYKTHKDAWTISLMILAPTPLVAMDMFNNFYPRKLDDYKSNHPTAKNEYHLDPTDAFKHLYTIDTDILYQKDAVSSPVLNFDPADPSFDEIPDKLFELHYLIEKDSSFTTIRIVAKTIHDALLTFILKTSTYYEILRLEKMDDDALIFDPKTAMSNVV